MSEDIAIIGIGCRFPGGVTDPGAYWDLLVEGRDAVRPVPADRWPAAALDGDPATPGRSHVAAGGFLDDPATRFDAAFFGISPREAETLDPQQRLLLEVAFEALEDAGVPLEQARSAGTGVFVGGFTLDSMLLRFRDLDRVDSHTATSSSMTLLSNRISYALDLHGPSMTIDTACSSSLVATHLAARALRDGECGLALAGGVNLMLLPNFQVVMCKGRFLAPDGRSKAFDADADGYGRGEGAGVVVLKRLADARRDGDRVYAVIAGTGVNQDGATDGIAQPSGAAQEALIRAVSERYGLDPARVGYVEAHGTGTALGDPVEVGALGAVYGRPGAAGSPRIGSVKANIGHLEAAAGVAGLIKATLAVAHRTVPPQRAPRRVNPALRLEERGLVLPTEPEPWPHAGPAVAAINSFGYGGTNAHAVVVEAPRVAPVGDGAPATPLPELLPISARGTAALRARAAQVADLLAAGAPLAGVASTLARHRSALDTRVAVRCPDVATAITRLRAVPDAARAARSRGVVWLYSGMGPQWAGMGRGLRERPAFRAGWDRAAAALCAAGIDVRDALDRDLPMERNDVAQPANFALQVALTEELRAHGAAPDVIVGHSTGEMAAAWAAGALSLEDAARVVAVRARLQQRVAGGGMLAVGLGAADVAPHLAAVPGLLEVAAVNAPTSTTIAGDRHALAALEARLGARGVFAKPVRVEVAYHSAHMDPVGPELLAALADLRPLSPSTALWSTVTAARVEGPVHDAAYWWANTRGAVRLADTLAALLSQGPDLVVQVGPHPVLAPAVAEIAPTVRVLPLLTRGGDDRETLLAALAGLWESGAALCWDLLAPPAPRVDLPAYPWQRRRYWPDLAAPPVHPLLVERLESPDPTWTTRLDGARWRWLHDHRVDGAAIVPGALWIEALVAAALATSEEPGAVLTDVRFHTALALAAPGEAQSVRVSVSAEHLRVHSRAGEGWQLHAEARRLPPGRWAPRVADAIDPSGLPEVPVDALYAALDARGLSYGPAFRGVRRLWRGDAAVIAEIRAEDTRGLHVPPDALDAAFQALLALRPDDPRTMLPVGVERVHLVAPPASGPWTVRGVVRRDDGLTLVGDLDLLDASGRLFLGIVGLRCRRLGREETPAPWWHRPEWVEAAPSGAGSVGRAWIAPDTDDPVGVDLLAALLAEVDGGATDLVVVTRGAWSVDGEPAQNPAHAALWGMARVVMTERPELGMRLLDVDADTRFADGPGAAGALDAAALVVAAGEAEEAALRGGRRFVARLRRAGPGSPPTPARVVDAGEVPARLVSGDSHSLDDLRFVACRREGPAAGEVEVEVEATSLNFKDVMKAMGLLDEAALEASYLGTDLGMEAVGRVVRRGDGVDVPLGQRVLVYAGGCFRTHARVDARFVVPCPDGWTVEQAASFFVTVTAWHALVDVGRLRAGETVLVHSAAGGVGLAAVGIARALGARVIATAGTARKRAWLRDHGVAEVFDSRTLDFADAARRVTGGRGVDVVLNALAGPAIEAGFAALAPGGRFLELGKKDLADRRTLALGAFNRRLTLAAIDLDRAATEDPDYFGPLARTVLDAFVRGTLPHLPARTFAADDAGAAFRALAGGDWIGKVVVALRGPMTVHAERGAKLRPGRTWLVTGGLGGFGLSLATELVRQGVTHLVLASRRGVASEADRGVVEALGATVRTVACDVADAAAVGRLVAEIEAGDAPLGGVVHAATAYADAPLAELTPALLETALAAKARGAWNLHRATLGLDLDGFVTCSSVSAQVGNPGQAGYAAANTFLDGLAELRRGQGLPGTSVALGALADTGLVARDAATEAHLRGLGLRPMPARAAAAGVIRAVADRHGRVGILDIDWDTWIAAHPATPWSRLDDLRGADEAGSDTLVDRLAALPLADRLPVALGALVEAAAPVFRMDAGALDPRRPLRDLGLDSLMAVELAGALRRGVGLEVSAMDLLGGRTLSALAERLLSGAATRVPGDPGRPGHAALAPPISAPWTPARLRAAICVAAPYEALDALRMEADTLHADVSPVGIGEAGAVSAAELGRHLAILGSMAVATRHPEAGRHAYPVHEADLEVDGVEGPPVPLAHATARATVCDPATGRGEAETVLYAPDGRRLGRMRVRYHVLPMDAFRALYASRAVPTPPGPDPYGRFTPARVVEARSSAAQLVLTLPPLRPGDCLGHFDGLPALPVSILGRHVFAAVVEAHRRAGGGTARLVRARLTTHRFVWAGERAHLVVRPVADAWECRVEVGDELAARFLLEVAEAGRRVAPGPGLRGELGAAAAK